MVRLQTAYKPATLRGRGRAVSDNASSRALRSGGYSEDSDTPPMALWSGGHTGQGNAPPVALCGGGHAGGSDSSTGGGLAGRMGSQGHELPTGTVLAALGVGSCLTEPITNTGRPPDQAAASAQGSIPAP